MVYILGHNPDEFGLVPDADGYLTFKELLWALHEEPGWGYVRQANLNEVLIGKDRSLFEVTEHRIRSLDRRWDLDIETSVDFLPKLLYVTVRRRAHLHALEKGLRSGQGNFLVLSPDEDMALRIGQRKDRSPVLLEVRAEKARAEGILFHAFGRLYLAREIPPRFIKGPPLPKESLGAPVKEKDKKAEEMPDFRPGTFVLQAGRDPAPQRRHRGKKEKGWKEEAKKLRRRKNRPFP